MKTGLVCVGRGEKSVSYYVCYERHFPLFSRVNGRSISIRGQHDDGDEELLIDLLPCIQGNWIKRQGFLEPLEPYRHGHLEVAQTFCFSVHF